MRMRPAEDYAASMHRDPCIATGISESYNFSTGVSLRISFTSCQETMTMVHCSLVGHTVD